VIAANRIGAKRCMWLVGLAATTEVIRRNEVLLRTVYRESRAQVGSPKAQGVDSKNRQRLRQGRGYVRGSAASIVREKLRSK
jgi:hypothetical protein